MYRSVSKLSQAAAHPRRGTNYTRNGISCKECGTCYTTRQEKAKGKSVFISKIYMQETMQLRGPEFDNKWDRIYLISRIDKIKK
jgi:hypothetical protein